MPAPTPAIRIQENERLVTVSVVVRWTTADNLTDSILVDVSAKGYTGPYVEGVWAWASPGLGFTLEFDDDTNDELIFHHPANETADKPIAADQVNLCLREMPGMPYQGSGGTGDILLTTTGAAASSWLSLMLQLRRPGLTNVKSLDLSYIIRR
jgi:hypothetical protein